MNPLGFPLLADENIHAEVIQGLLDHGKDVRSLHDEGLTGAQDVEVLRRAHQLGRAVLTHDSDFGKLAVYAGEDLTGIIYIRPGHISPEFVLTTIAAIESRGDDVEPPFIVVADRKQDVVRVRVRRL
jgi:predicted nuclease of predicted toxin-antitoxin system